MWPACSAAAALDPPDAVCAAAPLSPPARQTRNGRISMAGVNTKNVARLADAIHAVTSNRL
jgi:hypothetical protein